jgi:hypothetical protein
LIASSRISSLGNTICARVGCVRHHRDIYRKSKGAGSGKPSRNATKKRNKYGKIDKGAGRVADSEW